MNIKSSATGRIKAQVFDFHYMLDVLGYHHHWTSISNPSCQREKMVHHQSFLISMKDITQNSYLHRIFPSQLPLHVAIFTAHKVQTHISAISWTKTLWAPPTLKWDKIYTLSFPRDGWWVVVVVHPETRILNCYAVLQKAHSCPSYPNTNTHRPTRKLPAFFSHFVIFDNIQQLWQETRETII